MPRKRCILTFAVMVLAAPGMPSALAAIKPKPLPVVVPHHLRIVGNFTISFRPHEPLPSGGYYYAAIVLTKHDAKRLSSARCAQSSNMDQTEYDYPKSDQRVSLTLSPEKTTPTSGGPSSPLDWCSGATYKGAIYAVPHEPPCRRSEPCYGHSTAPECYSGEELCSDGKKLYGKIRRHHERAGELPEPRDSSTHMIARFRVRFGK